jgi:hypothetical protein
MTKLAQTCTFFSMLLAISVPAIPRTCPIVAQGGWCALQNTAAPPYYGYCNGAITNGPYFDSAALTFTFNTLRLKKGKPADRIATRPRRASRTQ